MKKIAKILILFLLIIAFIFLGGYFFLSSKISIKSLGVVQLEPLNYIGIKHDNAKMSDYTTLFTSSYTKIEEYAKFNPEIKLLKKFAIYQRNPENKKEVNIIAAYETKNLLGNLKDSSIFSGEKKRTQAMAFEVTGSYTYLPFAWTYSFYKSKHMKDYKINKNDAPFEVYEYQNYKDTKNNKTIIYIPVIQR